MYLSVDRTLVVHERSHEETSHKYDELDDGRVSAVRHGPGQRAGDMNSQVLLGLSSLSRLLGTSVSFSFQMVRIPAVTEFTSASA